MNRQTDDGIGWCDYDWNPTTGCSRGCAWCWARRTAETRLRGRNGYDKERPFAPKFWPERLDEPLHLRKPSIIAVSLMGDLYDPAIKDSEINEILDIVACARQHLFIGLTQRVERATEWVEHLKLLRNWIHGFTARKQIEFLEAVRLLVPAARLVGARLFCSFEPLLGSIIDEDLRFIDWGAFAGITIGALSGPESPDHEIRREWGENIRYHLQGRVPLYFKANWRKAFPEREWPMEKIPWPA
jgi:protein gp37